MDVVITKALSASVCLQIQKACSLGEFPKSEPLDPYRLPVDIGTVLHHLTSCL